MMHEGLLGSNAMVANERINLAWGEDTVGKSTVYRWLKNFDEGKLEATEEHPSLTTRSFISSTARNRMLAESIFCRRSGRKCLKSKEVREIIFVPPGHCEDPIEENVVQKSPKITLSNKYLKPVEVSQEMKIPTVKLSSGYEMPILGLGTWESKPGEVGKAVEIALNVGYTHIDSAWVYGNQVEIGEALKRLFSSGHKRENIFITSKVWNTFHSAPACKKHVVEILEQLQLEYIDLMLIHWPMGFEEGGDSFPKIPDGDKIKFSDVDYVTTWKVLEEFCQRWKDSKHWYFEFQSQTNRAVNSQHRYKTGCSAGRASPISATEEIKSILQGKRNRGDCLQSSWLSWLNIFP
ncbi:hypothetical protein KIN20_007891 [Parelaphostrongylus tenuis]|uniref:NADP-dependent oxidoreductase domain-containing protein n=1 Tax=Parelaphostrongylus tenuis TaxID=148309 RepID=A0AAD5M627_PARTN|nr:hypothetical protein KIN20_007891 [Parelaphostrongylus tenuis]